MLAGGGKRQLNNMQYFPSLRRWETRPVAWREKSLNCISQDFSCENPMPSVTESDSESGGALWTSLGLKVRDNGQLIFHLRHSENELRPMDDDAGLTFSATDRTTIGARYRYGNSRGALLLEVVGTREENVDESTEGAQYLIGAEYRLRDGIWMQLGVGDSSGDLTEDSDLVYSGQIRWAFSENRLFRN